MRGEVKIVLVLALAAAAAACSPPSERGLPVLQDWNVPQSHAVTQSWIDPRAKSEDLLYVSRADPNDDVVQVYSYRSHQLRGVIGGFLDPVSLCVDSAQNVYVVDYGRGVIYEYAHGSTNLVNLFADTKGSPNGCAVDPRSGDLAVTNLGGRPFAGSVLIYKKARSVPRVYYVPGIYYFWFPAYDGEGNLFVDGLPYSQSPVRVSELLRGGTSFRNVTLNQTIGYPGCMQWDGRYLAVGDQSNNSIYRFAISGAAGTLVGTTVLVDAIDVFQFWITSKQQKAVTDDVVLGADYGSRGYPGNVLYWYYPGGKPFFEMRVNTANTNQVTFASGVALSRATR